MNRLTGTWIANIEQSRRHADHQFQSATLTIEVTGDDVSMTHAGVNMSGKQESGTTVFKRMGRSTRCPSGARRRGADPDGWGRQMQAVRVFDELISNTYRDTAPPLYLNTVWDNLLITTDWRIWLTDLRAPGFEQYFGETRVPPDGGSSRHREVVAAGYYRDDLAR